MSYKREIILNTFQDLVFSKFGKHPDKINDIRADASEKKIYRLFAGGSTYIGVYNENQNENLAFINFTKSFKKTGLNVPEIYNVSEDNLFYLEEDLGSVTLFRLISDSHNGNFIDYYKRALTDLTKFQIEAKDHVDYSFCYQTNEFSTDVIEDDINKFNDHFSEIYLKEKFDDKIIRNIIHISNEALSKVNCDYFLYRDFQPRNIIIKDDDFYYIDYQSGRKGPLHYDAASFLYSGSIFISAEERNLLLDHYMDALAKFIEINTEDFKKQFYFFAFLRLLQVLGSYSFQSKIKKDQEILKKIPGALLKLKSLENKIDNKEVNSMIKKLTETV